MRFSNAFFRVLALIGVALLLYSVPAQRDRLGEPDRHGRSSSCIRRQCPRTLPKEICSVEDVRAGSDPCGAPEEFTRIRVEAEIARAKRTLPSK